MKSKLPELPTYFDHFEPIFCVSVSKLGNEPNLYFWVDKRPSRFLQLSKEFAMVRAKTCCFCFVCLVPFWNSAHVTKTKQKETQFWWIWDTVKWRVVVKLPKLNRMLHSGTHLSNWEKKSSTFLTPYGLKYCGHQFNMVQKWAKKWTISA